MDPRKKRSWKQELEKLHPKKNEAGFKIKRLDKKVLNKKKRFANRFKKNSGLYWPDKKKYLKKT